MRAGFVALLFTLPLRLAAEPITVTNATLARVLPALRQSSSARPLDVEIRGRVDLTQPEKWIVRNLVFTNNGQLVIRGNDLALTVKGELRSDSRDPIVVSFPPSEQTAARGADGPAGANGMQGASGENGAPGRAGADGLSSGNVMLTLAQSPASVMTFVLVGQSGGKGGRGGRGGAGGAGTNGAPARSGGFNCLKPAGNGGPGGRGGAGGQGGAAGACGRGGVLTIRGSFVPSSLYLLRPAPASAGEPGEGGKGGTGGPAGSGGSGGGFCSGGAPGPTGVSGPDGPRGQKSDALCEGPRISYPERK